MAADTKNKKDKPRDHSFLYADNVKLFVCDAEDYNPELFDFFTDTKNELPIMRILDQLGSLFYDGHYAGEDQLYMFLKCIMLAYQDGITYEDIEQRLRDLATGQYNYFAAIEHITGRMVIYDISFNQEDKSSYKFKL